MVITRKNLDTYSCLEVRIKSIRRRLRYFENHPLTSEYGTVKGSMGGFPYAECHFVVGGANVKSGAERDDLMKQLIVDLQRNERLFEDMKMDIELFIENSELLTFEEQTILRLKYIDRLTNEQIGQELGYDGSTVSRKIDKTIKKCEVAHNSQS